jgi:hypothetical protein
MAFFLIDILLNLHEIKSKPKCQTKIQCKQPVFVTGCNAPKVMGFVLLLLKICHCLGNQQTMSLGKVCTRALGDWAYAHLY